MVTLTFWELLGVIIGSQIAGCRVDRVSVALQAQAGTQTITHYWVDVRGDGDTCSFNDRWFVVSEDQEIMANCASKEIADILANALNGITNGETVQGGKE